MHWIRLIVVLVVCSMDSFMIKSVLIFIFFLVGLRKKMWRKRHVVTLNDDCLMCQDKYDLQRCIELQDKHLKRWFHRKTGISFDAFFIMMVNGDTDKDYKIAEHVLKIMEPYFKRGILSGNAIPPFDTSKSRQHAIVTLKRMCFLYQIEIYCECVCYDFSFRTHGGVVNAYGALQSVLNAYGAIYDWSIKDEIDCLTMFHIPLVFWRDEYSRMKEKYRHGYTLHRCRRIDLGDRFGI